MIFELHMEIEISSRELEKMLPLFQKIAEVSDVSADIHVSVVDARQKSRGFYDLPSKTDPYVEGEFPGLSSWYQKEFHLPVRAANILAREGIYPRELAEMGDSELLIIRSLGERSLLSIRKALQDYFTL